MHLPWHLQERFWLAWCIHQTNGSNHLSNTDRPSKTVLSDLLHLYPTDVAFNLHTIPDDYEDPFCNPLDRIPKDHFPAPLWALTYVFHDLTDKYYEDSQLDWPISPCTP